MNEEEEEEEQQRWGTLSELLLACAVHRHGTDSWDSVSDEISRRSSDHRHLFTPPNCRRRYADLRRRLGGDDVIAELRKLRVEELRKEVEKHDVSIEYLELKVKRLEEEREGTDLTNVPEVKKPVGDLHLPGGESDRSFNSTTNVKDEPLIKLVEPEMGEPGDEVPLAAKKIVIKSEPLVKILAIIRAHKNSSVFERRLHSQEFERYTKMIRQHIDLRLVQRRLEKGSYLHSQRKFFRDLLLLFTNALVFFPKTSSEYSAASELHKLAITQMVKTTTKEPEPVKNKPDPVKKQTDPLRPKLERAPSPPIVVCRRRSSIGSKPGSNSVAKSTKEVEVKVKMKNPKFDMKAKDNVVVKKPDLKEKNVKISNKKAPPVKEAESTSSEETEDDEEMKKGKTTKNKNIGKKGKNVETSKLIGKRGRPGKVQPQPLVAAGGRGGKRGKESSEVAVDIGRTRKRPRR